MREERGASQAGRSRRIAAAVALMAVGVLGGMAVSAAQQSNFMGGTISIEDIGDTQTLRILFPAGVRSNWHTHVGGGQLLMVEEGLGLHQVRGGEIELKEPGQPWYTPPGVEHWHGAHPDEDALQLTIYGGEVNWLDPVMDEDYRAPME